MKYLLIALLGVLLGALPAWAVNDFARSPWLIDSTGTTPITGNITFIGYRWVGPTTAAHKVILTDTTGRKILEITEPTGLGDQVAYFPIYSHKGVVVNKIDSGVLFLYFN